MINYYWRCETDDIQLLLNARADRRILVQALKRASTHSHARDGVLFYFAGHALSSNGQNYLVPRDGDPSAGLLSQTCLSITEILDIVASDQDRQITILIDACRSEFNNPPIGIQPSFNTLTLEAQPCPPNVNIIASATDGRQGFELPESLHGLFTHLLVDNFGRCPLGHDGLPEFQTLQLLVNRDMFDHTVHRFFKHYLPLSASSRQGHLRNLHHQSGQDSSATGQSSALEAGIDYCLAAQWEAATTCFEEAVQADADDKSPVVLLAYALNKAQRSSEAIAHLQNSLQSSSDKYRLAALGVAAKQDHQIDQAIAAFEDAGRLDPDYSYPYFGLGNILLSRNNHSAAGLRYQQAIHLEPGFADPYYGLGTSYVYGERYDLALVNYRKAVKLDPTWALPHCGLGFIHHCLGHVDAAITEYREAIRIDPDVFYSYYGMGRALKALERTDIAEANLRECVRLNPHLAAGYFELGDVMRSKQRFVEAIPMFEQAINLMPEHILAYLGLASSYLATDQAGLALTTLENALELDPSFAPTHTNLAEYYLDQQDYPAAWQHAQQALTNSRPGEEEYSSSQTCLATIRSREPELASQLAEHTE